VMDRVPIKAPGRLWFVLFLCGTALLTFGLYRWPPNRPSFTRARRYVHQETSRSNKPDFTSDSADVMDVFVGTIDYFSAASFLVVGLVVWRRQSLKGYRIGDLWSEEWMGGRVLWLLLQCHLLLGIYAVLVCVGLVRSLI